MKFLPQVKSIGAILKRLIVLTIPCMLAFRSVCQAFRPLRLDHLPIRNWRQLGLVLSTSPSCSSSSIVGSRMADNEDDVTASSPPPPLPLVVVIAGPTATGKSDVAARLCADKMGMIISADSVQAYRGVQIGANKPTWAEQDETPHILIDVADHNDNYNAAAWREDALFSIQMLLVRPSPMVADGQESEWNHGRSTVENHTVESNTRNERRRMEIQQTIENGRMKKGYQDDQPILPVICGGTMMYLQWLVHGQPDAMRPTSTAVEESINIIRKYQDSGEATGYQDAVTYVSSFGKVFADRTKKFCVGDWYRLRRTLEVALTVQQQQTANERNDDTTTNANLTDTNGNTIQLVEQLYTGQRQGGLASLGYDVRCFFLCPDDRMGHTTIVDERCEQMIMKGLIKETAELSTSGRLPEMAQRAIGYRQTLDYLNHRLEENNEDDDGTTTQESEDEAFDVYLKSFTASTRQYAKTQMAWFRKDKEFMFVPVPLKLEKVDRVDSVVKAIERLCGLSRSDFDRELYGDDSVSSQCKKKNAEQGKGMKYYQFGRQILKPSSKEFETVLNEAIELRKRFQQGKKRKIEEQLGKSTGQPS